MLACVLTRISVCVRVCACVSAHRPACLRAHRNFFYLGGGVKCDYDGHEKRFYDNVMLGTTAGCWHTCAYKKGYPDYCYNNTLVQAARNAKPGQPDEMNVFPFAIIWFCDAKNVSHILPDYSNEVQVSRCSF